MKKILYMFIICFFVFIVTSCNGGNINDGESLKENQALKDAIESANNYRYSVGYNAIGIYEAFIYEYDKGNIKRTNHNIEYILFYDEEKGQHYINYEKYYFVSESDDDYIQYYNFFKEFHLNKANAANYSKKDNYYVAKSDAIQTEFENVFNNINDEYICKSIKISFEIAELRKFNFVVEYHNKEYEIEIYISDYNEVSFDIPEVPSSGKTTVIDIIYPKEVKVSVGSTLTEIFEDVVFEVIHSNNEIDLIYPNDLMNAKTNYDRNLEGEYYIKYKIDSEHTLEIKIISEAINENNTIMTLQQYGDLNGMTYGLPSIGNSKALVIPVSFIDYKAPIMMKSDLEKAFFGSSSDTGWESLSSYYYKSSYGKLNITGTVLDVYNTGRTSTYYEKKYNSGQDADYEIIKSALEYYDDQINYDEYDSNDDGYIDSLYIVYTTPLDFVNNDTLWWAYTYEYLTEDQEFYDNVEVDFYCFLGYDFLFEQTASGKPITLNTETIIHETGHMLGLDDYYDYDNSVGPSGGIGGGDMMDYNIGDHNAFSKLLLGWVDPIIVTDSQTVNLKSFAETGQCVILLDEFNNTYFDEFYIIDYYTPNGLNSIEAGNQGLFSTDGIRIYHVDARIDPTEKESLINIFKYDNSYTDHRLISLIQASGTNTIKYGKFSTNDDLFKVSTSYVFDKWYTDSKSNFSMFVESILSDGAIVSFTKN